MPRKSFAKTYRAEMYLLSFIGITIYIMYYLYSLPALTPLQQITLKVCETILSGLVFAVVVSWMVKKIKRK